MKYTKVKITKLKELEDARHPNNIEVGFERIGRFDQKPQLGRRFFAGAFSTSGVCEIIDDSTFRTYSSIYKWEVIDE